MGIGDELEIIYQDIKKDYEDAKKYAYQQKKTIFWIIVGFIAMQFTDVLSLGAKWGELCQNDPQFRLYKQKGGGPDDVHPIVKMTNKGGLVAKAAKNLQFGQNLVKKQQQGPLPAAPATPVTPAAAPKAVAAKPAPAAAAAPAAPVATAPATKPAAKSATPAGPAAPKEKPAPSGGASAAGGAAGGAAAATPVTPAPAAAAKAGDKAIADKAISDKAESDKAAAKQQSKADKMSKRGMFSSFKTLGPLGGIFSRAGAILKSGLIIFGVLITILCIAVLPILIFCVLLYKVIRKVLGYFTSK